MASDTEKSDFIQRHHLGLGVDYVLRAMRMTADMFDGDIVQGLVFMAAVRASTQHATPNRHPALLAHEIFPDEDRRPTSLSALARSLGLPLETTRRHIVKLTDRNYLSRLPNGGVVVKSGVLERPELRQAAAINAVNLEHLVRGVVSSEERTEAT